MEGDWLWKPATFKGRTLRCVFFCMSRDFDGAHRSSRWRPVRSRLANRPSFLSFHRKSNNSFFQIWQEKVYWAMPGVNCSVYGCGSCRRTKGIGIFKVPLPKDDAHRRWRDEWLGELKKPGKSTRISGGKSKMTRSTHARSILTPRILKHVSMTL